MGDPLGATGMPQTWCRRLRLEAIRLKLGLPLAKALIRGMDNDSRIESVTYVKSGFVFLQLRNAAKPVEACILPEVLLEKTKA
jgi:hypothetical protein